MPSLKQSLVLSLAGLLAETYAAPVAQSALDVFGASMSGFKIPAVAPTVVLPPAHGIATWWGQGTGTTLAQVCADKSINIVILSFLNFEFGPGGYPTINFGANTQQPSAAQAAAGATGLMDGSAMASDISTCQSNGKFVYLSIGGDARDSRTELQAGTNATNFANQVWDLFLGGSAADTDPLRPFGSVKLDGIDLDLEDGRPDGYTDFVNQLHTNFATDSSKQYYVSGVPQCPRPDPNLPDNLISLLDKVWVQFYNQGNTCSQGAAGFMPALTAWSGVLKQGAELWIGAPASSQAAGSGYLAPADMANEISQVRAANIGNFAGVALWDAEEAFANSNYQDAVASALTS